MVTIDLTFDQACLAWGILRVYREQFGDRLGDDRACLLPQIEAAFEESFNSAFESQDS